MNEKEKQLYIDCINMIENCLNIIDTQLDLENDCNITDEIQQIIVKYQGID